MYVDGLQATFTAGDNLTVLYEANIGSLNGTSSVVIGDSASIGSTLAVEGDNISFETGDHFSVQYGATFGDFDAVNTSVAIGDSSSLGSLDVNGATSTFVGGTDLHINGTASFDTANASTSVTLADGTVITGFTDFAGLGADSTVLIGNNVTISGPIYIDPGSDGTMSFTAGDNFSFGGMYGGSENSNVNIGDGWISTGNYMAFGTGDDAVSLGVTGETGTGPLNFIMGGENTGDKDVLKLHFANDAQRQSFINAATAAGWTLNPDGTFNPQDANGINLPLTWNNMYISEWESVICFASGTKIKTEFGEIEVENLQVGTRVLTMDNGYRPILWIGSRRISAAELAVFQHLRPIRIRAGALGVNQPMADLIVSPQHRVLARSRISARMFNESEVLMAAKHLIGLEGVEVAKDLKQVEYWHFLFSAHEVVYSNGAATESLFTGPEALKAVSPEARKEMATIFPELGIEEADEPVPVRTLANGRMARKLVERVAKNRSQMVSFL